MPHLINLAVITRHHCRLLARPYRYDQQMVLQKKVYTLSYKRNGPGRMRTVTEENQFERLEESATPLAKFPYDIQLQIKQKALVQALKKVVNIVKHNRTNGWTPAIAKVAEDNHGSICPLVAMKPSPQTKAFRNKEELNIRVGADGDPNTIGLVIGRGENCICVPCYRLVNSKPLHEEIVKTFKGFIEHSQFKRKDMKEGSTRSDHWFKLMIRSNEQDHVMLVPELSCNEITEAVLSQAADEVSSFYSSRMHEIKSLHLRFRYRSSRLYQSQHHLLGDSSIYETVLGYKFRISPQAFFQLNTPAAEVLYSVVQDIVKQLCPSAILDIGCGTGSIGILMSSLVEHVVGLDIVKEAVEDAEFNAQLNGVTNCRYIVGGARKVLKGFLTESVINVGNNVLAVVNPNRNGLSKKAIERIRCCEFIKHLVYISCKPHGNAVQNFVDLIVPESADLPSSPFTAVQAIGVDMFPQTVHSELVMVFQR